MELVRAFDELLTGARLREHRRAHRARRGRGDHVGDDALLLGEVGDRAGFERPFRPAAREDERGLPGVLHR